MYPQEDLLTDLREHPEEAKRFLEMHWCTGVLLLCVDWNVAQEAAERFELETPDLGIFGHWVALFFLPSENGRHNRMMLRVIDNTLFSEHLQNFLTELINNSMEVVRGSSELVAFRGLSDDYRASILANCRKFA